MCTQKYYFSVLWDSIFLDFWRVNNTVLPVQNAVQVINNETMFITCMGQTLMDFSIVSCHGEDSKH